MRVGGFKQRKGAWKFVGGFNRMKMESRIRGKEKSLVGSEISTHPISRKNGRGGKINGKRTKISELRK
jgi:hypothetical protein